MVSEHTNITQVDERKIKSFEDLIVWQKGLALALYVYKLSAKFPKEEVFGLTSQIRRAANSISLNIAEGSVKSTKSFINHLTIANGSAAETLAAALLATQLNYLSEVELEELRGRISEETKMLSSLIGSLEKKL